MKVMKTYQGVDGGLWLDVVREAPGNYSVHAIGNPTNPVAYGFVRLEYAEEYVVTLQNSQRAAMRGEAHMEKIMAVIKGLQP